MNPLDQPCHHPDRTARGPRAQGHIRVHSRKQRRHRRTAGRRTFAAAADTPRHRLKAPSKRPPRCSCR